MHGANVQPGQIVMVTAEHGQASLARAVAAAAYARGAKFVDVFYFDPRIKRARDRARRSARRSISSRSGTAQRDARARGGARARISLAGADHAEPVRRSSTPTLVGKDSCRGSRRCTQIVARPLDELVHRPVPASASGRKLVYPDLAEDDALRAAVAELEHVLRLDEPDPERGVGRAHERV